MASFMSISSLSSSSSPLFRVPLPTRLSSPSHNRFCNFRVRCSYAEPSVSGDARSDTIDVVADVKAERIVVLGGNGFVGSAICKAAVSKGIEAVSLNRSGRPTYPGSWVDQVTWVPGLFHLLAPL
ncbi:hypothetical protein Tsubulata_051527 [Turnera subulata]|uniref:NAD-dependent epimerase/dehydratase domain-containing protein n=1 Tax=Turnera subulata TaxID=218843 RepID=A0A9Q0JDW1_9ROSI|nr:hypothetical protein Tsubulata_051527 [Turnera subulata]